MRTAISDEPIDCSPEYIVEAESDEWIVVNKSAPLIVHTANGKTEPNLLKGVEVLLSYEITNGASVSLVNRLDRETSGLTLIAKNKEAARELGIAMQERLMHKEYLAIVIGSPPWDTVTCCEPILRLGEIEESRIWVKRVVHPNGKNCETEFRVECRFNGAFGPMSLVRCIPKTGRTHQIRVHLSYLGYPIVGDKIYGPSEDCYLEYIRLGGWTPKLEEQLIMKRQALHACRLDFPFRNDNYSVTVGLPDDMQGLLDGSYSLYGKSICNGIT